MSTSGEFRERIREKCETGKMNAFVSLALRYQKEMNLFKDFGIFNRVESLGFLGGKETSFRAVAEHSLTAAMVSDVVLEVLVKNGRVSEDNKKMAVQATLLHDVTKRQELEAERGTTEAKPRFVSPEERKKLEQELLKDKIEPAVISFSSLADDGVLWRELEGREVDITSSQEELTRWVIFIADHIANRSDIVSVEERIRDFIERGVYDESYSWWYKKLFREEPSVDKKQVAKEVLDIVLKRFHQAESQLKPLLGLKVEQDLLDYIKQLLEERFSSYEYETIS